MLIAAAVIVVAFGAVLGVATATGPLRHTSFPGHPWPPTGFYLNPFSNSPDDLVNAAEAARVKADLFRSGDLELQAFTRGDPALLAQADAGNRLVALQQAIARNNQQGVTERWQNQFTSIKVGYLQDPRDTSVHWCVEERGSSVVEFVAKSNGAIVTTQHPVFDNKFWLRQAGQRYLITDAELTTDSSMSG